MTDCGFDAVRQARQLPLEQILRQFRWEWMTGQFLWGISFEWRIRPRVQVRSDFSGTFPVISSQRLVEAARIDYSIGAEICRLEPISLTQFLETWKVFNVACGRDDLTQLPLIILFCVNGDNYFQGVLPFMNCASLEVGYSYNITNVCRR